MSDSDSKRYATIRELAREVGLAENFLYQRSRHDALPGQFRVGHYVKIVREEFLRALEAGEIR